MLREEISRTARNQSRIVGLDQLAPVSVHLFHCLDYLRQNILCSMDTTLEWPTSKPGKETNPDHISGYYITHMCKRSVCTPYSLSVSGS